jgi:F420-dependent oxidoreductase-like protein
MRVGFQLGTDKERPRAQRLAGLVEDAQAIESDGFESVWIPQIPGYLDALTVLALIGAATARIELGTAVQPVQTRHPLILAQQALTTQVAAGGRLTLGLGPSHGWIIQDQLGLPYERPAALMGETLDVLDAAFSGPGRVEVENAAFRVHSPLDVTDPVAVPVVLSALAPRMLRLAGSRATGTILWMADERAIADHIVPNITKAAADAGRPAPRVIAGVPVTLCAAGEVDAARAYASVVLGHAGYSPNYERLLAHGDAGDVDDVMAVGDEAAIAARLRRYRDAGATDLMARIVPLGDDPETRLASKARTRAFLASLMSEL